MLSIGFFLVTLVCLVAIFIYWRKASVVTQALEKLLKPGLRLWLSFLLFNILFLIGLLFIITSPSSPRDLKQFYDIFGLKPIAIFLINITPAYKYMLPLACWMTLAAAQTIIGLLFLFAGDFKQAVQQVLDKPKSRILILSAGLAALSILAIGFSKTLPYLIMPDNTQGLRFARNINMIYLHRYIWALAIYFNLAFAWLWALKSHNQVKNEAQSPRSPWYFLPLIAAILFSYYWLTVIVAGEMGNNHSPSNWNVYYLNPDSITYIARYEDQSLQISPGYPLFIELVTAGTNFTHTVNNPRMGHPVEGAANDPLLLVTRTQKVMLLLASVITCIALMGLINSPLPVLLFLGLYEFGFFSELINHLLSETLAQAWLLLILATFFTFFWKRWRVLLPLAGIFCAGLYLTRPAGVFCGVLLAAMFLWALLVNWRSYWLSCVITFFIGAVLVSLPVIYTYLVTGFMTPTALYSDVKIAFALQIAHPQDVNFMPDENARLFLTKAIALKQENDAIIKAGMSPDDELYIFYPFVGDNVSLTVKAFQETQPNGTSLEWKKLSADVSRIILAQHRSEYYSLGLKTFWYATTRLSLDRITLYPYTFWFLVTSCLIIALLLRGWIGYCSITLILTHLFHLMIISFFGSPLSRYIWATEFLVFITFFILLWGSSQRLSGYRFKLARLG